MPTAAPTRRRVSNNPNGNSLAASAAAMKKQEIEQGKKNMEQAQQKINDLDDQIEMYFADEETMQYYQDPARLAREETQLKALQKEFEETFDDAVDDTPVSATVRAVGCGYSSRARTRPSSSTAMAMAKGASFAFMNIWP